MGRDGLRITKPQSLAKREIGRSHATSMADANCLRGKDLLPFLTTRKMRSGALPGDPAPRLRCGPSPKKTYSHRILDGAPGFARR